MPAIAVRTLSYLAHAVCAGYSVSKEETRILADTQAVDIWELMHYADKVRKKYFGNTIKFCSIVNAKSGSCSENCSFCAQSAHHGAKVAAYPLLGKEDMVRAGFEARKAGACGFSIVTSGKGVASSSDLECIAETVDALKRNGCYTCASLGEITEAEARKLKERGLKRFHHNLETSERFFSHICTTHSYDTKIKTIRILKKAGLEICSGGIFGMGETWEDRIDMAFALRELQVDSIPINFLNPIKGTPLEARPLLQ